MKLTLIIIVLVFCCLYSIYVSVIKRKNKVKEAFSSVNVQLKKRYDLIPNILTIAKKFMDHEKELMENLTKLRTQVLSLSDTYDNMGRKIDLDNQIKNKMNQLLVSVENYPQLKSDSAMLKAMQTYNDVEEHIAAARRFYNAAVNDLNNAVEIFPYSIFAKILGISSQEFFKIDESETIPINANDFFNK